MLTELNALRSYLLGKAAAIEDFPFGPSPLVLKVGGKMFALISQEQQPLTIALKCDPIDAQFLRDQFSAVKPGYHLNKRHWNTITLDGTIPESELRQMIDRSYTLVFNGLPKRIRQQIEQHS